MQILTTSEARQYIRQQTNRDNVAGTWPHKQQFNRWMRDGRLERHTVGVDGQQNTYTIEALDALIAIINDKQNT